MKTLLYISGIIGGQAIVLRITGIYREFSFNPMLLWTGVALLTLFMVLLIVDRHSYDRKIDRIIEESSKDRKEKTSGKEAKSEAKGWSMNNSPFRQRKSGLSWGGGNIKASGANMGVKRRFLK